MQDIKSNSIQSLSKVIENTQSGYATKGFGEPATMAAQQKSLMMTVVASNPNTLVLQANSSKQRISVSTDSIQGLSNGARIKVGDTLQLLGTTARTATFHLQSQQHSLANNLPAPVLAALSQQWQELSLGSLKKAPPSIQQHVTMNTQTQQAKDLLAGIIDLAAKSNQPTINIRVDGTLKKLSASTLAITLNSNSNSINAQLPINAKMHKALSHVLPGSPIQISINANSNNNMVERLSIAGTNMKTLLPELNKLIQQSPLALKETIGKLVLSDQAYQPKLGLVTPTSTQSQKALGNTLSNALLSKIPAEQLKNSSIALTFGAPSRQSTQHAPLHTNKLNISVLSKPVLLNIPSTQLHTLSDLHSSQHVGKGSQVNLSTESTKPAATRSTHSPMAGNTLQNTVLANTNALSASHASVESVPQIKQLHSHIGHQLNVALAQRSAITPLLPDLAAQLSRIGNNTNPELKSLLQGTLQAPPLASQLAQGSQNTGNTGSSNVVYSSEDIKAMFSAPIIPSGIGDIGTQTKGVAGSVSNISNSGLINGLVTMLQASLQAKFMSQQAQLGPQIQAAISAASLPTSHISKNTKVNQISAKTLQEIQRGDPRSTLIGTINKVLSNHSVHKLAAAEASLQGQDSFYYALPNLFSPDHKDIEIVIKRECEEQQKDEQQTQQHWQLSMKLDIGKAGEVLAKVKLINDAIDLHMYASNETLKQRINALMPMLAHKLSEHGLRTQHKCFVGKIPDNLYKTDFQVVHAYV
ncbi:MAG: flagellar hook-length control protein FliK [Glaciecola sp.]